MAELFWPLGLAPFEDEAGTIVLGKPGSGGVPADAPLLDDMMPETDRGGAPESDPCAEEE